jgi:hypothetical protein
MLVPIIKVTVPIIKPPLPSEYIEPPILLHQTSIKNLKDALAHLGPYQTLMEVLCSDTGD